MQETDRPSSACGPVAATARGKATVFLINHISGHGHVDSYARLYSACLLELGYRVVLIAERDPDTPAWLRARGLLRDGEFRVIDRADIWRVETSESVCTAVPKPTGPRPPLTGRIALILHAEGASGVVRRVVPFVFHRTFGPCRRALARCSSGLRRRIAALRRRIAAWREKLSPSWPGMPVEVLVAEVMWASIRLKIQPDFVFFLYLDLVRAAPADRRYLEKGLPVPWGGILFHPRCNARSTIKDIERYFLCRNFRGAGFLNPHLVSVYRRLLPQRTFVALPDVTETATLAGDSGLIRTLRERAAGRTAVLLAGSLGPHKGVMALLDVIRRADRSRYFFAIVGEVFWHLFGKDEPALRAFAQSPPENCIFHPHYLDDEREITSIISMIDIIYAVYLDFADSSNTLTKASVFEKPLLVSDRHLMGERVREYDLGLGVAEGDPDSILQGIERLRTRPRSEYGFARYRAEHSLEALKAALGAYLAECLPDRVREGARGRTERHLIGGA